MLSGSLVCLVIGMWISDVIVMNYRAELDAGNLASGSLADLVNRLVALGKISPSLAGVALSIAGNHGPKGGYKPNKKFIEARRITWAK